MAVTKLLVFMAGSVVGWVFSTALAASGDPSPVAGITPAVSQTLQSSAVVLNACGQSTTAFLVTDDGFLVAPAKPVNACLHVSMDSPALEPFAATRIVTDGDGYVTLFKVDPRAVAGRSPIRIETSPEVAAAARTPLWGQYGSEQLIRVVSRGGAKSVLRYKVADDYALAPSAPIFTQDGSLLAFARGPNSSKALFATDLDPLLAEARSIITDGELYIPTRPLSEEADDVVTPAQRAAGRPSPCDLPLYAMGAWDVWVQLLTPASLETLTTSGVQAYTKQGPFFLWPHHLGMSQPRVVVQRAPVVSRTAASRAKQFGQVFGMVLGTILTLGGAAVSGASSAPAIGGTVSSSMYQVSNHVDSIELMRDGVKIQALEQSEDCFEEPVAVTRYTSKTATVSCSRGCTTLVSFPPEAFAPGAVVVLRVRQSSHPSVQDIPIPEATLERITADFEPYFQARREREALASR